MEVGSREPSGACQRRAPLSTLRPWTLPNALTLLRLLLVVPFVALYLSGETRLAILIFALAALSDGLDGLLARLLDQRSRLGLLLDPVADKLLSLAALIVLVAGGSLPSWLLAASLARDVAVLLIAALALLTHQPTAVGPVRLGKYATLFTNAAVLMALIRQLWHVPALDAWVRAVALLAGLGLVTATAQYCLRAFLEKPATAARAPQAKRPTSHER